MMAGREGLKFALFRVLVGLFVGLVPVSQLYSSRALIILVVSMPFLGFTFSSKNGLRNGWDILLFIVVLSVGLAYSSNVILGLRQLETSLSLLGVLWVFGFFKSRAIVKRDVIYPFVGGVLLASVICLLNAGHSFAVTGDIRIDPNPHRQQK